MPENARWGNLCRMKTASAPLTDVTPVVRQQYEAYPYPARNPADEKQRLITGSPSALLQIQHFIYGGRLPEGKLRFLAAGGGSGDGAIMMAQQAVDLGIEVEVVHLDLSTATQSIARKRAEIRGLTNMTFVQDTLLNAAQYGPFDYIDCCGVLHHLTSPTEGLKALKAALKPGGGMGIMTYAPLGRTGVYPLQAALRRLTDGIEDPAAKVKVAKKLLAELPESNWLKRNPLIKDHEVSDAGIYDLLLHSTDRSYSVMEMVEFIHSGELEIISFIEKLRYDPMTYIRSPELENRLPQDRFERAALAEEIGGVLLKHIAYITTPERWQEAEAKLAPEMIPVYSGLDGQAVGKALKPGMPLKGELNNLNINLPMPRLAGAILQRIDGKRDWRTIHSDIATALGSDAPGWDSFWQQASELYQRLNSINVLLLKKPA